MKRSLLLSLLIAVGCGGSGNKIDTRRVTEHLDEGDAVTDDGRFVDSYWFRGLETGTAIANIDSSDFDPLLVVYDQDGRLVARNDDGGAGNDARASFRVGFGQLFEVIVTSANAEETGKYELTVSPQLAFDSVITRDGRVRPSSAKRSQGAKS